MGTLFEKRLEDLTPLEVKLELLAQLVLRGGIDPRAQDMAQDIVEEACR